MLELVWYGVVAAVSMLSLVRWRQALYAAVFLEAVRDPVRKLSDSETILITLSGAGLWLLISVVAVAAEWNEFARMFRRYRQLRAMLVALVVAIVPASLVSIQLYQGGYKLVLVGAVSYLAPIFGVGLGYLFAESEKTLDRLLTVYVATNAVLLVGVPLEFLGFDLPGLGGLQGAEWVRYHDDKIIDLIGGFYRSPDIMGLHASHVAMFSMLLMLRDGRRAKLPWALLATWAVVCLLLCGRRKMIVLPLVFAAAYLVIGLVRRTGRANGLIAYGLIAGLLAGAAVLGTAEEVESSEYVEYAGSTFTEGVGRVNDSVIRNSIGTMRQVGLIGGGLGTATQGRYYLNVETGRDARGWQEDGVSRVIMEFGVPGAIMLVVAAANFLLAMWAAVRLVGRRTGVQHYQIALVAVVLANAASFVISHQQYSGDPASALFAAMAAGMVLGLPRVAAKMDAPRRMQPPSEEIMIDSDAVADEPLQAIVPHVTVEVPAAAMSESE